MTQPLCFRPRTLGVALSLLLCPGAAWATAGGESPGPPCPVPEVAAGEGVPSEGRAADASPASFQAVPVALSGVPGLLFHGLGTWVAGDTRASKQLFALEGAGLGLLAVGGVPIALTGASRRTIGPLYLVALSGAGLFSISAAANLYAAVSPAFPPGAPAPSLPPVELELGYQHVYDPAFDYRHFLSLGATARLSRVRLEGALHAAPGEGNTRVRMGGAYRLLGAPESAREGAEGTALEVEAAGVFHRFGPEGFAMGGVEAGVRGRYDMVRLSRRLEGSFAEVSAGMAFQGYSYFGPVSEDALHEQLLFSFGYGVYLGRQGPVRGEALLYYNHRKDDYAGGVKAAVGVLGYFGVRGRLFLSERWGVSADVQAGSAYTGRVSAVYALGGER
ncbi:hypothetical protein [Stigmatella aurantiaca]|uniref:Conserved uncharacterized protein n=1 Tax=Stigmatella aurantiaca (strain DW4/3-1) TaxID=378806 RepID=Q08PQ6_STIAD|nr:hypothetical protein [Stigmatella aurantiaca]ADO76034.1 conserved uncharacterized protein [Stigmatella aurantiaca DW4/3-1]EAU62456.1 hypothetical protein STIAU_3125 [Stigmatella aurantiaca DW4/3-1]